MIMSTKTSEKPTTRKKINWALPNQTVTHAEFMDSIKEAEKGPFMTIDEFEQRFEVWKHKKGL
jgi:hypothetical protein